MSKFEAPPMNQLIEEWEVDAEIRTTHLVGLDMLGIPMIHSKYNKYLSLHKLASLRKKQELESLRRFKWRWINGKFSDEEYEEHGLEPFRLTVLKTDQGMWLDADEDIQKLTALIALHDECASFCTLVMKELNARTYQIKSFMEWERFIGGQK